MRIWSSTLWPTCPIRLFAHNTTFFITPRRIFANRFYHSLGWCEACALSPLCRRIWRYWTSKITVRYIMSIVCLRLSQFSQLSFMQYMGLCVFSQPISRVMIMRIRVLYLIIIIKPEVTKWVRLPLFRVRSWNNGMRCKSYRLHSNNR